MNSDPSGYSAENDLHYYKQAFLSVDQATQYIVELTVTSGNPISYNGKVLETGLELIEQLTMTAVEFAIASCLDDFVTPDVAREIASFIVSSLSLTLNHRNSAIDENVNFASAHQHESTKDVLQRLANQANETVKGNGAVNGTKKHRIFKKLIDGLDNKNLETEIRYYKGITDIPVNKGWVRFDVVEYSDDKVIAVYDLKTGSAKLTTKRIEQIIFHLPEHSKNVPIIEIRPTN